CSAVCSASDALAPCPSSSTPRSLTTTLAPSAAIMRAISRPMPRPAPVTSTTLPSTIPAMRPLHQPLWNSSVYHIASDGNDRSVRRWPVSVRGGRQLDPQPGLIGVADVLGRQFLGGLHVALGDSMCQRVVLRDHFLTPLRVDQGRAAPVRRHDVAQRRD